MKECRYQNLHQVLNLWKSRHNKNSQKDYLHKRPNQHAPEQHCTLVTEVIGATQLMMNDD